MSGKTKHRKCFKISKNPVLLTNCRLMFNDHLLPREYVRTVYFARKDLVTKNVTSLTVSAEEAKIVLVVN